MFDKFPFTNVHELNMDWILRQLKDLLRRVKRLEDSGGGSGTGNYNDLSNKPKINNVTLQGNKSSTDLNIPTTTMIRAEINHAFRLYDPAEEDYNPPYEAGTLGYAIENAAIDPEDIQDAVDAYLDDHPTITGTFTNAAKNALLDLLEKVAYKNGNGQTYLNTLRTELFAATITSITAVFTQGAAVIYATDSLETLTQYLVVTASYSDGTSESISNYTLSGSLTASTSTITVSYEGQTDTFNVTVTGVTLFTGKWAETTSLYFASSGSNLVYYKDSTTGNRLAYILDGTGVHPVPRANTSQTSQTIYLMPIPQAANVIVTQTRDEDIGARCFIAKWTNSKWAQAGGGNLLYDRGIVNISGFNDGTLFVGIVLSNRNNDNTIATADRTNWSFGWA